MEREGRIPKEGFIFRKKNNPYEFSSELYIEVGLIVEDYYDEIPIEVFEEYQTEQEEKMRLEMGEITVGEPQ